MTDKELTRLARLLVSGAIACGFPTELWTLARVAKLIEREFDRAYGCVHVWRLLKQLGFSSQRPAGRAMQRHEAAIAEWKAKRWPRAQKKARREARTIVFVDESGLSERSTRVKTWAPKGRTPVLRSEVPTRLVH